MISAVVLAAGKSSRFGEPKQLLAAEAGMTVLETVVKIFESSKVDETILVLGYDAEAIVKKSKFGRAKVVVNRQFEEGLSSSLRKGIEAVDGESEAVVVALGDEPLVAPATVDLIVRTYIETRAKIVAPYFRRRRGNPVLFARGLFGELLDVTGDVGAKGVIERHQTEVTKVQVDDMGVVTDIDTKEDYRRFKELSRKRV